MKEILKLTRCQKQAVEQLLNKSKYILFSGSNDINQAINFQAPTGSGKTFIVANYCDQLIKMFPNTEFFFIFATLSTGDLHKQNQDKLDKYAKRNKLKYNVEIIESISNNKPSDKNKDYRTYIEKHKNTIYCIGTSSCTKSSLLYHNGKGPLVTFFDNIRKRKKAKIIYIRDEAHIGTNNNPSAAKTLENLVKQYSDLDLYLSATLDKVKNKIDIKITLEEAAQDHLIKSVNYQNDGFDKLPKEIDTKDLIKTCLDKFVQVKKDYINSTNPQIKLTNPALLIQIPSQNQSKLNKDDDSISVLKQLGLFQELEKRNLKYVLYTADVFETNIKQFPTKFNETAKQAIINPSSLVDVVIFKVALATGWDIPRACMLLQIRDVCSESLNIQTIGRIRRNPIQQLNPLDNETLYHDDLIDSYWIYSNNAHIFNEDQMQKMPLYLKYEFKHPKEEFQLIECVLTKTFENSEQDVINNMWNSLNDDKDINCNAYVDAIITRMQKQDYKDRCKIQYTNPYIYTEVKDNRVIEKEQDSHVLVKYIYNIFDLDLLFKEKVEDETLRRCLNKVLENYLTNKNSLLNKKLQNGVDFLKIEPNYNYFLLTLLDIRFKSLLDKLLKNAYMCEEGNYVYQLSDKKASLPDITFQEIYDKFDDRGKKAQQLPHEELLSNGEQYRYYPYSEEESYGELSEQDQLHIFKIDENNHNQTIEIKNVAKPLTLYFDSLNEKYFFDQIINLIKIKKHDVSLNKINYYVKNYTENSKLCFQYKLKDKNNVFRISESYPDFILKYKDKTFFLEIKDDISEHDYDAKKTESLINAYDEFNKLQTNVFFSVVKINKDHGWIKFQNPKNSDFNDYSVSLNDFLNIITQNKI